ncbi:L-lactate dehydrogenase [Paenibacillus sp. NFR01]|uniref:L-lactate dehydrogenase n=1 Tax=Paenibacillus sp. NFR01 TaxID=1566279 RepID=UPI0008D6E34E|nr:L-lactate dehydrogenase [Paenibacillus sp. NFR01]SEU27879.1 L-lactate dehydrogenase [Paenibacillus sp. NFR01]
MKKTKIAIVGIGRVGATLAYQIINTGICDELILINKNPRKAWAEAMDLNHAMGYSDTIVNVIPGDYAACRDADLVVLSVSAPYVTGMTRLDMLESATDILKEVVPPIMDSGFNGIFLVITNPVDVMTYLVQRISGLPPERVIGTGTSLDSSRLRKAISDLMGVDSRSVDAFCMGEHGDSQMVPWSQVTVGSKKFLEIIEDNPLRFGGLNLDEVSQSVTQVAYQIVEAKGATSYAISYITAQIIEAIIKDKHKVLPVSVMLNGEYGERDVYCGVPAVLTSRGVKELVEYNLTEEELGRFKQSIAVLRGVNAKLL